MTRQIPVQQDRLLRPRPLPFLLPGAPSDHGTHPEQAKNITQVTGKYLAQASGSPIVLLICAFLNTAVVHANATPSDLERITVTGSQYTLATRHNTHFLSKERIESMPHIADDIFRLMPALPGVAAGDYSANFFVRGGHSDEVLVLLDGQQLYRPFHMKSFNSAFSIVDTDNVGAMDFSSGGFTARYGNKMSGVMAIESLYDMPQYKHSLGVSFINARAGSQGTFDDDKGTWLVSVRRGYLDLVLDAVEDESNKFEPIYADLFAKVSYELTDTQSLSGHFLYAWDDEILDDTFTEWDGVREYQVKEKVSGEYSSAYAWAVLHSDWRENLSSQTLLSVARVEEDRSGGQYDPTEVWLTLDDNKFFYAYSLKQDWQWRVSDSHYLESGFEAKYLDAEYDYWLEAWYPVNYDGEDYRQQKTQLTASGNVFGAYISDRWRLNPDWVAELGLRWDQQDYYGFTKAQWSPRVALLYQPADEQRVSLSAGDYYQPEDILSLQVADGTTEFHGVEKARHVILSYQHVLSPAFQWRAEAYLKKLSQLRPWYENAFDLYEFLPEGQADRYRVAPDSARVKGVELSFQHHITSQWQWQASYSWSNAQDSISGRWYPRSWDQRHAVKLTSRYQFDNGWQISGLVYFHSGWPMTGESGRLVKNTPNGGYEIQRSLNERNQLKLGNYKRIDMRIHKIYPLSNSELTVFFEVSNLLNFDNECCIDRTSYSVDRQGKLRKKEERGHWLPIIPSFGVKWAF
ncbi:TonB-dependent receptor [Pseudoalteromonas sp. McH1-42]|uniref:TonB-dependent receptor plug domain-containing protein n=1 Tax=Pseudoalteromonas sp. McH1-42 TaxID=2917752 RepID=UPI001EF5DF90|nr:TonB-dependent receptor [Pseudoalteromonas sp. McH1-42]MCG7563516.1 TonB-dependent receptor [Pseudoalteromonas sp. McH1-42]